MIHDCDKYIVRIENDNIGPQNYAETTWFFDTNTTPAQAQNHLIYFHWRAFMAAGSRIIGISRQPKGEANSSPMAFDLPEWLAFTNAIVSDGGNVPAFVGYGQVFGFGGILPTGTSLLVSEAALLPGRSGRGRVFIPFPQIGAVNPQGQVQSNVRSDTDITYQWLFGLGNSGNPWNGQLLTPPQGVSTSRVWSNLLQQSNIIISGKTSGVFSSLASRRR